MFGGLGMWEVMLIFLVVLLLFGARRLPEIGSSLGKGIREFKSSIREIESEMRVPEDRRVDEGRRPAATPPSAEGDEAAVHRDGGEPRTLREEG